MKKVLLAILIILISTPVFAKKDAQLSGKIVFSQLSANYWQVWIMDLNGSNPKQLTSAPEDKIYPAISGNGKKIAYVTNSGKLWIMDSDGKNNQRIDLPISCFEPKFSPDGEKIAFTSYEDIYHGNTKLWEVNLKTKKLIKLVNKAWLQYNPGYSPDGKFIIFTDGPELYGQEIRKLNLETKDITQLTDNGPYDYDMQASFFANGERIVYSSNQGGNYNIWMMDKFGGDKINLIQEKNSFNISAIPSKDGKSVFFISDKLGAVLKICKVDLETKTQKPVSSNKTDILSFSVYEE